MCAVTGGDHASDPPLSVTPGSLPHGDVQFMTRLRHYYVYLRVSFAENVEVDVVSGNAAHFVCIMGVYPECQATTLLSPVPRPLHGTLFLVGDVQFVDSH
ncbi:hypothetical protein JTE90_006065 [Oedothorax gibbosus]|uniref:Uncharacterized protein n=1 Tax=Oedothorax gibbosus TaxID=931172 RepID=A0AAV6V6H2_9ARAC|nr:hypothetical protein JTE90_006065 [Oedothorax gibbosus]